MMFRTRAALLAATLVTGGAGLALAQGLPRGPAYDPAQLPETKGKIAQYTLTPHGEVDGFILADGTEVHLPPHLSTQVVFALHPGEAVTIHGLKAKAAPMVAAASVTNDATGATITDNGPPGPREESPLEVTGKVKAPLHSPRGDINGVLLEDGTIIRLPPPEAQRLSAQLAVGQTVYARGDGLSGPLGKVVAARALGASKEQAAAIAAPPPGPHHGPHEHGGHGLMGMFGGHEPPAPPPGGPAPTE